MIVPYKGLTERTYVANCPLPAHRQSNDIRFGIDAIVLVHTVDAVSADFVPVQSRQSVPYDVIFRNGKAEANNQTKFACGHTGDFGSHWHRTTSA